MAGMPHPQDKIRGRRFRRQVTKASIVALWALFALATSAGAEGPRVSATPVAPIAVEPQTAMDPLLAPPPPPARQVKSWDDALALLRAHSPDYVAGQESVLRAAAQARIALGGALPTLNAQGIYVHQFYHEPFSIAGLNFVAPPPDTFAVSAVAQWIVSPRAIYAVGTADRNAKLTKLSFEDQRRLIATSLVDDMLSTLAASRVAELNRVGLRSALDRLALTETRLQYGQGTALDVDRAQQDAASARATIITGDEALRQAREDLGVALGSPVPTAAPGDLQLDEFEAAVARTCRLNDDIERRPDVTAARARIEIAERAVTDADLMYAPSLVVGSQAQAATVATLSPLNTWNLQAALNLPLFDGGVRYGARRDAKAALEQARQALIATRLAALVSAARAERAVSVYQASRDVAQRQRDLAATIDRRTRESYAQGAGTSLDLVVSAQSLRQAEINLVLLEIQVGEARANTVLANAECVY
jgi:outer membrane protein, multidrug efflux system